MAKKATDPKQIETITHEARRTNIPTRPDGRFAGTLRERDA